MAQVLLDLVALLADAAHRIDAACKEKHATFPSLDDPLDDASEAIRNDPVVTPLVDIVAAAAQQILATARSPTQTVLDLVYGVSYPGSYFRSFPYSLLQFQTSSCLRTVAAINAAEALRQAGPKVR